MSFLKLQKTLPTLSVVAQRKAYINLLENNKLPIGDLERLVKELLKTLTMRNKFGLNHIVFQTPTQKVKCQNTNSIV